jgi:hypothetical protein
MSNTVPNVVAGSEIYPSRFVRLDETADYTVLQADDNEVVFGISHEGSATPPIPSAPVFAGVAGKGVKIYGAGEGDVLLEAGGTIVPGDRLKSDEDGKGVAIALTGSESENVQNYGAIALEGGSEGDKIRVFVSLGAVRPTLP